MSSLIFCTDETQAFVATDTLVASVEGEPSRFTTKTFIIPHLRMLICGVGILGVLGKWFTQINDYMLVRGIENLNFHATSTLNRIWYEYSQEVSIPNSLTTTIYHFGFSEESGLMQSFAYRSENNFESESLPYGLAVKPFCNVHDNWQLPNDLLKLMKGQRDIQSNRPLSEKVFIGGEIMVHHLQKDGYNVFPFAKFDDYDSIEHEMYKIFVPVFK